MARIKARDARRDDAKLTNFADNRRLDLQAHLRDFAQLTTEHIVFVDTEQDLETNITQIVRQLSSQLRSSLDAPADRETPHSSYYTLGRYEGMGDLQEFKQYLNRAMNIRIVMVTSVHSNLNCR